MKHLIRLSQSVRLLFGLTLGLAAPGAFAADPTAGAKNLTKLSTLLVKQAELPNNSARAELLRYADQLGPWLAGRQYAELEQALIRIRVLLPEDDKKAVALLEQVEASLQNARAQARAKDEEAYRAIETDFLAKFTARAPAAEFDVLLARLAGLTPLRGSDDSSSQRIDGLRNYVNQWQDYLLYSASGNSDRALSALDSMVQQSARLPIIPRSLLVGLRLSSAEQLKKGSAGGADKTFTDLQQKLGVVLASANKASDFDAIVAAVREANRATPNNNLLNILQRTTLRWQNYYAAVEAGNAGNAANTLNGILSDDLAVAAMPRSKILAMHNLDRTNAKLKDPLIPPQELTLDNLDLFKQQVAFRRNFGVPSGVNLEALFQSTRYLGSLLDYLNKKQAAAVFDSARNWLDLAGDKELGAYAEPIARVRRELFKRTLVMYFEPPADLLPNDGDTLATYSSRLIEQGKTQHDWPLVYRVLTAATKQRVQNTHSDADLKALGSFLDGLQNERAGLWGQAVFSYYQALQARSPYLPAEEVGVRLARIKREHPDEYNGVKFIQ